MKPRLKAHGWTFVKATRAWCVRGGNAVEIEFAKDGVRHWFTFYPDGSACFSPVTICLKNGEAIL
jgi:hypothetical protein